VREDPIIMTKFRQLGYFFFFFFNFDIRMYIYQIEINDVIPTESFFYAF
jgi:hypothetical protein